MNTLIQKYNRPAPRYTSYPPVPFWNERPCETTWIGHLKDSYSEMRGVDLYVHIPFCESLCYYCGCNRTITKNHGVEEKYLGMILKEWNLYKEKLGFTPKINSLHFGGGTPTFLSAETLDRLINQLLENKSEFFIGSIEIDPRRVNKEQLAVCKKYGITRISLGIQDFNPDVQKSINRLQSPELVEDLVETIRAEKFESLNFDLIYGLPKQTLDSIHKTFQIVSDLRPDLIAFYSYAHLPDKIKNQKFIKETELPTPEEKRALYNEGKKILEEIGYVEIGMDHFALPGSFLSLAMKNFKLQRNFMGYVDRKSNILLGLGPTSIADSSLSFMQNEKDLKKYEERLNKNELPHSNGHTHSREDLIIQNILQQLMCQQQVDFGETNEIPFWMEIEKELLEFQEDGLLVFNVDKMQISPLGKSFIRNIALAFDFHHRTKTTGAKFSQTI